jgi:transposase
MVLIGSDFHPSWQQVSWLNQETGETGDGKLVHEAGAVEKFYRQFPTGTRIGMEATGNCQWFLELLAKLGHEVWIGDAAKIRASDARQQKHDKRDARLLLQLLMEQRFPRIWVPSREQKDLRQLLIHRYKLVRIRAQVKNGLQHLAMNQGLQKKKQLWSVAGQQALRGLPLQPWASRRREDLLKMRSELDAKIDLLDEAVAAAAEKDERARLLMTQPGVGPITSMAFVLTIGDVSRFPRGKQVASYLGLIPREYSSGGHQRLGQSVSRATRFCACCWWKRRKEQYVAMKVFATSICIAAIASRKVWPKWQRQGSCRYDFTGCYAATPSIQRSFMSRAARGCPWSASLL